MELHVKHADRSTRVKLSGPIDGIALAGNRAAAIIATDGARDQVVVDIADVPFIDASGLGLLTQIANRLAAKGKRMSIANASGQPAQLFAALGLESAFAIAKSERPASARDVILRTTRGFDRGREAA